MYSTRLKELEARYWAYFFLNKLDSDSSYQLPSLIRFSLINMVAEDKIKEIQDKTYEVFKTYLILNNRGPIKDYSDTELLTILTPLEAYQLSLEQLDSFLYQIKEYFTPIEYIQNSQNPDVVKKMKYDGAISPREALEIFGVKL